jgi:hypothetical protein
MTLLSKVIHPFPSEKDIEIYQKSPIIDRKWSCFDLSICSHITNSIFYAGEFCVEICNECGKSTVNCEHRSCEWDKSGALLRCKTCGMDCT